MCDTHLGDLSLGQTLIGQFQLDSEKFGELLRPVGRGTVSVLCLVTQSDRSDGKSCSILSKESDRHALGGGQRRSL